MSYKNLSDYSLLRMIAHAIGIPSYSVFDNEVTFDRIFRFLSHDTEYAPPSIIKRELLLAKEKGIINISEMSMVSVTEEGRRAMEKEGIVDGINFKWYMARDNEKKAKQKESEGKDGRAFLEASKELRNQVSIEGLFWRPDEWKRVVPVPPVQSRTFSSSRVSLARSQPQPGEIQVTRKPRAVKKVE